MKFKLYISLVLFFTSVINMQAYAEDIEIYVNKNTEIDEKPRVLFIFDTSGSMDTEIISSNEGVSCFKKVRRWSWRYGYYDDYERLGECYASKSTYNEYYQQCYINVGSNSNNNYQPKCVNEVENETRLEVAKSAVKSLIEGNEDIDFGLMRFNYNADDEPGGGYVLARVGTDKKTLLNKVDELPAYGSTPLTETLWEAYLYITGSNVKFARKVKDRDTKADIKKVYKSPFISDDSEQLRCDNSINIILMTDGEPQNDEEADNSIEKTYKGIFKSEASSFGSYKSYLVALAKILHGTDNTSVDLFSETPDVIDTARLFTIGFGGGMGENALKLLEEAAEVGGGDYFEAKTAATLSSALKNTISQIREENSTFISPSFASNNVDQTRSRDSIYLAMFYPDSSTRWRGNLKKLKVSGNDIIDSSLKLALNSDGVILKDAKTFWSVDNSADGSSVKSGGVNGMLADMSKDDIDDRQIFTDMGYFIHDCDDSDDSLACRLGIKKLDEGDDVPYFSDEISKVEVGEFEELINWARGVDVGNSNSPSSVRNDIFGDPLHSKPVAIDYGNNDIRILIGTNAGFLHMFKDDDVNNEVKESWAFIPSALFNILKPLREEDSGKKYGMDGPISVYSKNESLVSDDGDSGTGIIDARKKEKVWAFAGMRRGGRNYYGFNITDPDNPKLKWTIQGGEGKFTKLGQTWSKPQVAFIKAFGDKPVLVFGGGYDENKDASSGPDSVGNNVYIVDANAPNAPNNADDKNFWSLLDDDDFKGKHSIAADVTLLDSDYDGYIDRIYAADTGGNVWRIDMPSDDINEFSHHKVAELGEGADRRFFYKPVVARTMFSKVTIKGGVTTRLDSPYDAVVIGSGKRTNPNDAETADQLFMIRDENTVTQSFTDKEPTPINPENLMVMNDNKFSSSLNNVDGFIKLEADLALKKGWRYELATGEKSLAAATVVGGVAYFTSFTPASDSSTKNQCSLSGGGGSLYAFHLHYGTKVYDKLKFDTSNEVPDTPQLYFGSSCADSDGNGVCDDNPEEEVKSQFYLIGPGIKGEDAENPLQPLEITGPGLKVVNGKIQLVKDKALGFGFKTQQTYIYKREENDEIKSN